MSIHLQSNRKMTFSTTRTLPIYHFSDIFPVHQRAHKKGSCRITASSAATYTERQINPLSSTIKYTQPHEELHHFTAGATLTANFINHKYIPEKPVRSEAEVYAGSSFPVGT